MYASIQSELGRCSKVLTDQVFGTVLIGTKKEAQNNPVLMSLLRLTVSLRINFNILVLVYKWVYGLPANLVDMMQNHVFLLKPSDSPAKNLGGSCFTGVRAKLFISLHLI